mmetsp:Transcript_2725/g.10657  ORF Transcript_2725/g.10657 Transcript_2725/m.10657 type:complete len:232 (-) Transcript_2725:963-1658(-)
MSRSRPEAMVVLGVGTAPPTCRMKIGFFAPRVMSDLPLGSLALFLPIAIIAPGCGSRGTLFFIPVRRSSLGIRLSADPSVLHLPCSITSTSLRWQTAQLGLQRLTAPGRQNGHRIENCQHNARTRTLPSARGPEHIVEVLLGGPAPPPKRPQHAEGQPGALGALAGAGRRHISLTAVLGPETPQQVLGMQNVFHLHRRCIQCAGHGASFGAIRIQTAQMYAWPDEKAIRGR